jgi:hypothetical protein
MQYIIRYVLHELVHVPLDDGPTTNLRSLLFLYTVLLDKHINNLYF